MPQKDFILYLIEEAVEALAQILGLRDAGQPEQALKLLDRTARRFVGLDLQQLDLLPYPALRELLSVGTMPDIPRVLLLAELRRLEGELRQDLDGPTAGRRQSVLALRLFMEVGESRGLAGLGEYRGQLDRLATRLERLGRDDAEIAGLLARLESLRDADARETSERGLPENGRQSGETAGPDELEGDCPR